MENLITLQALRVFYSITKGLLIKQSLNQSNPSKVSSQKLTASAGRYALKVTQMQCLGQKMPEFFKTIFIVIYKTSKILKN